MVVKKRTMVNRNMYS